MMLTMAICGLLIIPTSLPQHQQLIVSHVQLFLVSTTLILTHLHQLRGQSSKLQQSLSWLWKSNA